MKNRPILISVLILLLSFHAFDGSAQNALDLDGVDDFVSMPNASYSIVGGTGISISCFVYPRNTTAGWPDMDGFVGFRNNLNTDFYLIQTTADNVEARFTNSAGVSFDINYNGLLTNSWNHFVLSYDGAMLRLYHYGVAVDSVAANGAITNISESFFLGDLYFGASDEFFLDGQLDEVGIWSAGLTASEINCLYNSGPDLTDPDLKHYFHFNQGVAGGNNTSINYLEDQMTLMTGGLFGFALNGSTSNWVNGTFLEFVNLDEMICSGETYDFNGQTLSMPGTYFTNYPTPGGCDSSVVLNLDLVNVNAAVIQNDIVLTAAAPNAIYQWIDCADSSIVVGATAQSYTATVNGDYAVIVTQMGCTDTSSCASVFTIGIDEVSWLDRITVRPNPMQDHLMVQLPDLSQPVSVDILDLTGKLIESDQLTELNNDLDVSQLKPGMYFLRFGNNDAHGSVQRVLKL